MKPSIVFKKIWQDDCLLELLITVSNGESLASTRCYVGPHDLALALSQLQSFRCRTRGSLFDLRLGEFGPEYAEGAFHARFEFLPSGHRNIAVTVNAESDWFEFTHSRVANRSTLYLWTEPAMLDQWISSMEWFLKGSIDEFTLEALARPGIRGIFP